LYETLYRTKPYRKEIKFVTEWANHPHRILDVGCGTANYWKYFPSDSEVFGIEQSKHMIDRSAYCDRIVRGNIMFPPPMHMKFDCATALFNVVNYTHDQRWWKYLPLKKGGYFIFDAWDKRKVDAEGFHETIKVTKEGIRREITPKRISDSIVKLAIQCSQNGSVICTEHHEMYIFSHRDFLAFCGSTYEIVETKTGEGWQKWYKLLRK
jgi:SAM-dependent methyltransferase